MYLEVTNFLMLQDTAKIEEVEKETEESTVLIPKMEADIIRFTQQLGEEEKLLEEMQEGCKGVILLHRNCLLCKNLGLLCHDT